LPIPTTTTTVTPRPDSEPTTLSTTDKTLSEAQIGLHLLRLADLARQVIRNDAGYGPGKGLYWRDGSFGAEVTPVSCWVCYDTPATTAGMLSETRLAQPMLRTIAITTWTHAIRTKLLSNGAIRDGDPSVTVGVGFFAVQLGLSYLELKPYLSASTRRLWADAVVRMANYLIDAGDLSYYVNGNVILRQTEVMWLAWAITHDRTYYQDYESEYSFTVSPPAPRWSGYGLRITAQATEPLDANGAGYLTESGGGAPGFDPSYSYLQLDLATQMYVLTRDDRFLELTNLLFNQLRPRVGSAYILDAKGGTRKDDDVAFLSAAPLVLLLSGSRPGLSNYWLGELAEIHSQFIGSEGYISTGFYDGVTDALGTAMLAIQYPHGILASSCSPKQAPCEELFAERPNTA
jgi:hypothetical protein